MRDRCRMVAVVGVSLMAWGTPVTAQSALEGASGETSISIAKQPMGFVSVNTADKKVKAAWKHYLFSGAQFAGFGLEASVKAANSVGSLLRSGELVPEAGVSGRIESRVWRAAIDDNSLNQCIQRAQDEGMDQNECLREFPVIGSAAALWGFARV
jgi:hypothetical protein